MSSTQFAYIYVAVDFVCHVRPVVRLSRYAIHSSRSRVTGCCWVVFMGQHFCSKLHQNSVLRRAVWPSPSWNNANLVVKFLAAGGVDFLGQLAAKRSLLRQIKKTVLWKAQHLCCPSGHQRRAPRLPATLGFHRQNHVHLVFLRIDGITLLALFCLSRPVLDLEVKFRET